MLIYTHQVSLRETGNGKLEVHVSVPEYEDRRTDSLMPLDYVILGIRELLIESPEFMRQIVTVGEAVALKTMAKYHH